MQNNPAFSTLSKSKNTDIIFHFPVPKCLEIHSELSDWIIKSSVGKIQPFRTEILLNCIMGQRQHKHLRFSPSRFHPVVRRQYRVYNDTIEKRLFRKNSHSLKLFFVLSPRLDFQSPKPERSEYMEKVKVCVSVCSPIFLLQLFYFFISPVC